MRRTWTASFPAVLAIVVACAGHQPSATGAPGASGAGWRSLFDGKTLNGWREYKGGTPTGWFVKDGALTKDQGTKDIVSIDEFGDFELELDWKIHSGGNAG